MIGTGKGTNLYSRKIPESGWVQSSSVNDVVQPTIVIINTFDTHNHNKYTVFKGLCEW